MPKSTKEKVFASMEIEAKKEQIKQDHIDEIANRLENGETLTVIVDDIYQREYLQN